MKYRHKKRSPKVPKALRCKRLKICKSGKRAFHSLTDANIFLARMKLKEKNERRCGFHKMPIRAYYCSYCGLYHVTSRER